jgi:hypothetical protein
MPGRIRRHDALDETHCHLEGIGDHADDNDAE